MSVYGRNVMKALVLLALVCCVLFILAAHKNVDPRPARPDTVTYVVEPAGPIIPGVSGSASITMENGTGGTEQDDVTLPWRQEFIPEPGQFLYISAQRTASHDWRGIKVSILVNGKEIRQATSTAEYGIATVSTRMP